MYKVFRDREACLAYLVDVVFCRAENLGVPVLDMDNRVACNGKWTVHPRLRRSGVLTRLRKTGRFRLGLTSDAKYTPEDFVSVGIRETEVE